MRKPALPCGAILMTLALAGAAGAQQPAPPGMSFAEAAARRFPQPVRVGDLIGRTVLQPLESQPVLGHVRKVVRAPDGTLDIVVDYDGFLDIRARPIAVPADATALLGEYLEIVDFTPKQLDAFPTFDDAAAALQPGDVIRVGLARPSH